MSSLQPYWARRAGLAAWGAKLSALAAILACGGSTVSPISDASNADGGAADQGVANDASAAGDATRADDVTPGDGGAGGHEGGSDAAIAPEEGAIADATVDTARDGAADAEAGADVSSVCPLDMTPSTLGGNASSSGFSGSPLGYDGLYGLPCQAANDCVPSCVTAGGTMSSCSAGSDCVSGSGPDGGLGCLPPPYWLDTNLALSELNATGSSADLILVSTSYFDSLVVTGFGLSVPDDATIQGIQFTVRHGTLAGGGQDKSIQVLQSGALVGNNHRQTLVWPTTLTYATYGGPGDTWGVSWTPAEVRASGFGIAITPQFTQTAGNDRAYVDSVRVVVYFTRPCD